MEAKVSQLQSTGLEKGEHVFDYLSRMVCRAGELEKAGHAVSEVDKKHGLLRALPTDYDVTTEAVIRGSFSFRETVSKLIVRETSPDDKEKVPEKALAMTTIKTEARKCFHCGTSGHVVEDCRQKKREQRKKEVRQARIGSKLLRMWQD